MTTLGIIPARGGSKGVPRKNIRLLGGKPLIVYTIEAALSSRLDRTIVSTDDQEIAEVARAFGAEVPFLRPANFARDSSSSLSVLLHALQFVEAEERFYPDCVAFLQPTSPFRTASQINAAIDLLMASKVQSVIGICEVDQHPYDMFQQRSNGRLDQLTPMPNKPLRRQDYPPIYIINSALLVSRRGYYSDLSDPEPVFSWSSLNGMLMDRFSSIDIDTEFDFLMAEAALSCTKHSSLKSRWLAAANGSLTTYENNRIPSSQLAEEL
ncbi:MAG: acylneuraminate cytidylyltransferase family protein [bacterium]|nr:acylneuraminate cytidylyltransferase family protein [bacterium]